MHWRQSRRQAGSDLVGKTIRVFWRSDNKWYNASVCGYDSASKRHHVKYEDGEEERLDLQNEQYQVVVDDDAPSAKKARTAAGASSSATAQPAAASAAAAAATATATKNAASAAKRRASTAAKGRKRISTPPVTPEICVRTAA